jgi:hypothetical protein
MTKHNPPNQEQLEFIHGGLKNKLYYRRLLCIQASMQCGPALERNIS